MTIDLYDIESKGRVAVPDLQNGINRSVTGQLLPLERVTRDANGNIVSIEEAFQNSGSQKARGIDFGIQYQVETRVGIFTWLTQASYLDSFQFSQLPGETERELRGGLLPGALSDEGYLKWRANSRVDWAWRGLDIGLTAHYLDGFHERLNSGDSPAREHYVKQTWFFDVQASYNFTFVGPPDGAQSLAVAGKDESPAGAPATDSALPVWKRLLSGTTITLGCNNVFGQDPPSADTTSNYADFLYDSTGRFVYLSLTTKF